MENVLNMSIEQLEHKLTPAQIENAKRKAKQAEKFCNWVLSEAARQFPNAFDAAGVLECLAVTCMASLGNLSSVEQMPIEARRQAYTLMNISLQRLRNELTLATQHNNRNMIL